jgi:hypothetical protein
MARRGIDGDGLLADARALLARHAQAAGTAVGAARR